MDNKKVVSVSMVKNECDIIELFVRNNLLFLDEMYIVEHKCSDTTLVILQALKNEGLPIHIFRYNAYDYNQSLVLTAIHDKIIDEGLADFVLFCDADELIHAPSREIFRDTLISEATNSYLLSAHNYNMTYGYENTTSPLYEKFVYRQNAQFTTKTISNIQFIKHLKLYVSEGGHHTRTVEGAHITHTVQLSPDTVFLAHIPYRSKEQMLSKVLVGCLSYNTREPNFARHGCGVQWYREFNRIMGGGGSQVEVTNIPIVHESNIDFNYYTKAPLLYQGGIFYDYLVNVDALSNLVNFSLGYVYHHHDENDRADIVHLLNNIDPNNRYQSVYDILSVMSPYIEQKSASAFDPSNLEEL